MAAEPRPTPKPVPRRIWSLRRFLVAGVMVWLPIIATLWVVRFVVNLMDRTLVLLPAEYQPKALFGFSLPGVGVVFAFLVVLLTGLAVTNLIGRQLMSWWEELLQRIPVVSSVYGSVKSFTESVLSSSNSFRQVVALEYPRPGAWGLGFLTATEVVEVSARVGKPLVCVYVPTAVNPTSGFIVMVPREEIIPLDMHVDEAMKMIVTGGVVQPPVATPLLKK